MNESAKFREEYGEVERVRIDEDAEPRIRRPAEVEAVNAIVNPPPPARTKEQHHIDMVAEGKELCLRCMDYKHWTLFGRDERNTERRGTQTICMQCDAERNAIKDQVKRTGKRAEGYRYQARGKGKRKRRRK